MNKKKLRKLLPVALCALIAVGSFAWLSNKETAVKVNKLQPGSLKVVFDNQTSEVSISNQIPMTQDYAVENLSYYTFTVDNDGSIAVDYVIGIDADDYSNTFAANKLNIVLAPIADDDDDEAIKEALKNPALVQKVGLGKTYASVKGFEAEASDKYALIVYVDESAVNEDCVEKAASFHLFLDAKQPGEELAAFYTNAGGMIFPKVDIESMLSHSPGATPAQLGYTAYTGDVYKYSPKVAESFSGYNTKYNADGTLNLYHYHADPVDTEAHPEASQDYYKVSASPEHEVNGTFTTMWMGTTEVEFKVTEVTAVEFNVVKEQ